VSADPQVCLLVHNYSNGRGIPAARSSPDGHAPAGAFLSPPMVGEDVVSV
jgi:hypothetical protein